MGTEIVPLIVIVIRTLVPFTILRWPLGGMVLAILADASDAMVFEKFGVGYPGVENYHVADKFFDTYYLFFAYLVVHRWKNTLARRTAKVLFLWRFAGFVAFEFTGLPYIAFLAPNIFENFYLFWAIVLKLFPSFKLTPARLAVVLFVVGFPKVIQEYLMHYKYPGQTWHFFRDNLFWWLYK